MTDDRERERLRWQCRRGMLELDLMLQKFIARELEELTERECIVLKRLLRLPDDELLDYCYGRRAPHDLEVEALVRKIAR